MTYHVSSHPCRPAPGDPVARRREKGVVLRFNYATSEPSVFLTAETGLRAGAIHLHLLVMKVSNSCKRFFTEALPLQRIL